MPEDNICKKCGQEMEFLRQETIAGTKYKFLKCGKCKKQIARAQN